MASMTQDFEVFFDIFLLLVPLEILSHYPDIDNSHWLKEDVQWVVDKVSREKFIV